MPTGRAILSSLVRVTRARAKTMGARTMKATSKKIGMPTRKATIVTAMATRCSPSTRTNRRASVSAPSARSMSEPSMAPSATTVATEPSALPMPVVIVSAMLVNGTRVAMASRTETVMRAMKALILSPMTSSRRLSLIHISEPTRH